MMLTINNNSIPKLSLWIHNSRPSICHDELSKQIKVSISFNNLGLILVRYTTKLLHALVTANNGYEIGNVIGFTTDTQTWRVKYLTLNLTSEAANALNTEIFWVGRVHYSTACLPISLIAAYEDGILKIDRNLGQLGCKNGIIEC